MTIVAATTNEHKLTEFRRILEPMNIEVISASDAGCALDIEETGTTFMENAELKARALFRATGLPSLADDSGLCVDALGGAPGVYSARYGGENLPHIEKIALLLSEMKGIPKEKRGASFVAAIYCVLDETRVVFCEGKVEGKIGYEARGKGGFGYDPVFMTGGRSFAELSDLEKDAISHRGKALRAFCEQLREL